MNFKTPLAVVVAYDKQFAGGLSVYEDIYHSYLLLVDYQYYTF